MARTGMVVISLASAHHHQLRQLSSLVARGRGGGIWVGWPSPPLTVAVSFAIGVSIAAPKHCANVRQVLLSTVRRYHGALPNDRRATTTIRQGSP